MKRTYLLLFVLCGLGLSAYSQESITSAGGDGSGSGGTVAYTVGQIAFTYKSDTTGNVSEGVQQSHETFTVGVYQYQPSFTTSAYPNPVSDFITIDLKQYTEDEINFQLVDIVGNVIQQQPLTETQTHIDLSPYTTGIYFIKVIKNARETTITKIIKL